MSKYKKLNLRNEYSCNDITTEYVITNELNIDINDFQRKVLKYLVNTDFPVLVQAPRRSGKSMLSLIMLHAITSSSSNDNTEVVIHHYSDNICSSMDLLSNHHRVISDACGDKENVILPQVNTIKYKNVTIHYKSINSYRGMYNVNDIVILDDVRNSVIESMIDTLINRCKLLIVSTQVVSIKHPINTLSYRSSY
jgi:hypothetical protein